MDLVFKIIINPNLSEFDTANINCFVMARNIKVDFNDKAQMYKRMEDMKVGIALVSGVDTKQVIPSTLMALMSYQLEGYAKPMTQKNGYSVVASNGLLPKATRAGRKAIKCDANFLRTKLKLSPFSNTTGLNAAIHYLCQNNSKIMKDLTKIDFTCENIDTERNNGNLLGFQTLYSGFSFVGCIAHDDHELAVFFIIYWDGKAFRAYIPNNGNVYNTYNKSAFGADYDEDLRWMKDTFPGKYNRFDITMLDDEGIEFDWKILKQEIETRIAIS